MKLAWYSVLWTLSIYLGGTCWALPTTYMIARPIANGLQRWIDRMRGRRHRVITE